MEQDNFLIVQLFALGEVIPKNSLCIQNHSGHLMESNCSLEKFIESLDTQYGTPIVALVALVLEA